MPYFSIGFHAEVERETMHRHASINMLAYFFTLKMLNNAKHP